MQGKPPHLRNGGAGTRPFLFWAGVSIALLSASKDGQAQPPPFITATPNPVPAGPGEGSVLLQWDVGTDSAQVFLVANNGPEQLVAESPRGESQEDYISAGAVYEFRLYQGTNRDKLVAKVQVTREDPVVPHAWHVDVGAISLSIVLLTLGAVGAFSLSRRFRRPAGPMRGPVTELGTPRSRKPIPAWSVIVVLASVLGVLLAVNVWWMTRFRTGYPLDTDEAQFLADGFDQADAARAGGIVGLWDSVQQPSWHAPLLPLVVALGSLACGKSIALSLAVVQVFWIVLALSAYGVGKLAGDARSGLLAAGIVATSPGTWYASRSFHSTVPSVALFTAAFFCMLKSRGLRSLWWSAAFGLLVGLTALTRSVSFALLPGLFLAGGCQLLAVRGDRVRRFLHLVLAGFLALGVAAVWYGNNYRSTWEYLTSCGYGAESAQYNGTPATTPWQICTFRLRLLVNQELHIPLCLTLTAVGLATMGTATWRSVRGRSVFRDLRASLGSVPGLLLISAVFSYAVLTSSQQRRLGLHALPGPAVGRIGRGRRSCGKNRLRAQDRHRLGIGSLSVQRDGGRGLYRGSIAPTGRLRSHPGIPGSRQRPRQAP